MNEVHIRIGRAPGGLRQGRLLSRFAQGLRMLMWAAVPVGVIVCGCGGIREEARIIVPETVSPKVTRILQDVQSYVSRAYNAKDGGDLRKLSGLSDAIMECWGQLLEKRGRPAPSAQEWGGVSDQRYSQILKMVEELENQAKWCRDYAGDMRHRQLEVAWSAFVAQYGVFRRVVEDMGT